MTNGIKQPKEQKRPSKVEGAAAGLAKKGIVKGAAKVAAKLGIKEAVSNATAAIAGALGVATGPLAPVVAAIGKAIGYAVSWIIEKVIGKFVDWVRRHKEDAAIIAILGAGLLTGSPFLIAGGLAAAFFFWFSVLFLSPIVIAFTVIAATIIGIILVTAFIIFIINSGAFVVPPGPPSASAFVENPYIGVEKVARRAGSSGDFEAFLEFENSNLPVTIEYKITVTAKRGTLTNISFSWTCRVIREIYETCPAVGNIRVNGEPPPPGSPFPPNPPSFISPTEDYVLTYEQQFRRGLFEDSLTIDSFSVTADVEGEVSAQTAAATASIKIGNPPDQCPAVWPALPEGAESSINIFQGAYTGPGFSHSNLEALDISTTVGHKVYAGHTGIARVLTSSCLGNYIEIEATCGDKVFFSRYAHLEGVSIRSGETVSMGQQIGVSGNTGSCKTGPHLHYAFHYASGRPTGGAGGTYVNNPPYMMRPYIPKDVPRGCIDLVPTRICTTNIP